MLDFASTDPKGEGPKRPVGAGMAVTADDRHARLRHAQLWADDVHYALLV